MKDFNKICEFNTKLARKLQNLKKDCEATTIRQNYKGTGSQKFRRQIFTRFKEGLFVDIWLENDHVSFGGIQNLPVGMPKMIRYEDRTVDEVYDLVQKCFNNHFVVKVLSA